MKRREILIKGEKDRVPNESADVFFDEDNAPLKSSPEEIKKSIADAEIKTKENIENVDKENNKNRPLKKRIINILSFVLNLAIVFGILFWNLSNGELTPLVVNELNIWFVILVFVFLAFELLFDTMSVSYLVRKNQKRPRRALSYKALAMMRYYDNITPMSTGGQPFMIAYLKNRDVDGATATTIPIIKSFFQNLSWLIITFCCLIGVFITKQSSYVSYTAIVGFILALFMIAIILLVSLSKKIGRKLVYFVIKVGYKLKIIKNYDKTLEKANNFIDSYQTLMKNLVKNKKDVFVQFTTQFLRQVVHFCVPYFICRIFTDTGIDFFEIVMFTGLIELSSSFIPLPGGTGMSEITFTSLFQSRLGAGFTFWALLLWRFCTYYFYLVQGIVIITYDTLYGNRKYKWVQKRHVLQMESQFFKHEQIEKFKKQRLKSRKKA